MRERADRLEQVRRAVVRCVEDSRLATEHVPLLSELRRVLLPGGMLFVFEHNPLNPLTVRAVRTCEFDENARLIDTRSMRGRLAEAGFDDIALRYRIFFPGFLRRLRPLEAGLAWCPLGAQYSVSGRRGR